MTNLTTLSERKIRNRIKGNYINPTMPIDKMKAIESTKAFVWNVIVEGGIDYRTTPRACHQLIDFLCVNSSNQIITEMDADLRRSFLEEGDTGPISDCLAALVGICLRSQLIHLGFCNHDAELMTNLDYDRTFNTEPNDMIRAEIH